MKLQRRKAQAAAADAVEKGGVEAGGEGGRCNTCTA